MECFKLSDFDSNRLLKPKMVKLEGQSGIPTGGHFSFVLCIILLRKSLIISEIENHK